MFLLAAHSLFFQKMFSIFHEEMGCFVLSEEFWTVYLLMIEFERLPAVTLCGWWDSKILLLTNL